MTSEKERRDDKVVDDVGDIDQPNCPFPPRREGESVKLRKRKKRGRLRDRTKGREDEEGYSQLHKNNEIYASEEEAPSQSITAKMVEIRSDQSSRMMRIKRQKQFSTVDLPTSGGESKEEDRAKRRTMKEMIGNNFAAQETEQYGGVVNHEALLEKYINDKLKGELQENSSTNEVKLTEEEMLYRVPKELYGKAERSVASKKTSENALSQPAAISEVALPSTYRLENVAATEEARQKQERDEKKSWAFLKKIKEKQKSLSLGNQSLFKRNESDEWDDNSDDKVATRKKTVTRNSISPNKVLPTSQTFEPSTDDDAFKKFCTNQRKKYN